MRAINKFAARTAIRRHGVWHFRMHNGTFAPGERRDAVDLCRRDAPGAAPMGPARAANRYGHGFEIFDAVRVRCT